MSALAAGKPADANLGPVRAKAPESVAAIRRYHAQGVPVPTLADAFGVSVRTVYRYLGDQSLVETVTVGGWTAEFGFDDLHCPRRLTPWRRA